MEDRLVEVEHRALFSELVRLETELWNAVDLRLRREHALPLSWYEPMQVMERTPACRVHDIADELVITVGGTSKLVDRIESAGLCERTPNPADRRSSVIELTESGAALLAEATRSVDDELDRRFGHVSAIGLGRLHDTLRSLREVSRALDDDNEKEAARA
ncbi:MAG: MarR family transcriptional regulator [Actinomycetota bacterium]